MRVMFGVLFAILLPWPLARCGEAEVPAGYHLVAEDDCGAPCSDDCAKSPIRQ